MESDSIFSNDLDEFITNDGKEIPFERSFASYKGKTEKGKLKIDCWVSEKNNGLLPREVTKGTSKKYWFQCDTCPHLFKSSLSTITQKKCPTWCPYCAKCSQYICKEENCNHCYQKTFVSYDGKTGKGVLKKDCWNIEKNDGLTARDVLKGSNKKRWFQCDNCNHNFQTTPNHITSLKGTWCPYCSEPCKKICVEEGCDYCYQKSLESYEGKTKNGKLKKDCWLKEKNNGLVPRQVYSGNNNKMWFQCDICYHPFQQSIRRIIIKGNWCPYCSVTWNKICDDVNCSYCYQRSFAGFEGKTNTGKLKKDCWIVEKNNGITPREVYTGKNIKYWFQCDTCPHIFNTSIEDIVKEKGTWCPYCSIPTKKMCGDINCGHCIQRSFAGYEGETEKGKMKKDCWIIEKNNGLTPRDIMKSSGVNKFWFQCDVCNHDFQSNLVNITCGGNWCPYCSNQKMCDDITCSFCVSKSFEGFEGKTKNGKLKKECWMIEQNNGLTPRDVFLSTSKKITFQCDCCSHIFTSSLNSITREGGNWCPYCSSYAICKSHDCGHCFKKSFASYEGKTPSGNLKIDYWIKEKNNGLTPRDITKSNDKKFWFQCDKCMHQFKCDPAHIIRKDGARWCPQCKNKTEQMFQSWFKDNYEYKLQSQKRFKWCKNPETNRILPFDFCIPDLKLIIEIDGDQHFRQVWNWKAPELQQERDVFKMNLALDNGYTTIRIYQPDIYSNRNNWDKETEEAIKKYDVPEIICIGRKQLK